VILQIERALTVLRNWARSFHLILTEPVTAVDHALVRHDVVMLGALAEAKHCEQCGAWRRFYQCLECGTSLCRKCGELHEAL
jgi:hypothetical protein